MSGSLQRWYRQLRYGAPIIVVSGLPRSGTSMMMRMLTAGGIRSVEDGIRTADEDNPRGYFEDERVKDLAGATNTRWLREARGHAIKVISFLIKDLPDENNYKVLFVHRNLNEVLASQAKMLERRGEAAETSDEELAARFRDHLERVRISLRLRACFEARHFEYTDILADPAAHAARIQAFLDRPLDVDAMVAAVDPSLYRNRA